MIVLGVNAYHADASAVLLRDGGLVAAVEEERLTRVKHAAGFPDRAIRVCLQMAGVSGAAVDHVAVSRRPRAHLLRKLALAVRRRPSRDMVADRAANHQAIARIPDAIAQALSLGPGDRRPVVHWVEHHPAHLASAFFVSPFDRAAVSALDGFGDFVSTSWGSGRDAQVMVRRRVYFPHSLGALYLALTQYLGFTGFGDEFKVMGLAPYGAPDFVEPLSRLIALHPDGGFTLDLSYFTHPEGGGRLAWRDGLPAVDDIFSSKLETLLGPRRRADEPITARHEAIAASLQEVFERAYFHVLNAVAAQTGESRLCLAGGCAMNSVANGKITDRTPFRDVFIQPAAADNGTALGAAYWVWHHVLGKPRAFVMSHGYWGPEYRNGRVDAAIAARQSELRTRGCTVRTLPDADALCDWTAAQLADGRVVGWYQGAMEWGARALGNRSILADPRRADIRDVINARIKHREKFRPFAPSVMEEARDQFFADAPVDPFMMRVRPVRDDKRALVPAITHVDGSGRLQTVSRDQNPLYWNLLRAFGRRTGVPMLLNTSFNEQEPIVHTPEEALDCFLRTEMDVLVLGDHIVTREPAA